MTPRIRVVLLLALVTLWLIIPTIAEGSAIVLTIYIFIRSFLDDDGDDATTA